MNRGWLTLVTIGVIAVIVLVSWDVVLTITGNKSSFNYNIVPMNNTLFGNLEDHLKADPNFSSFQQLANPEAEVDSGAAGGTQLEGTPGVNDTPDTPLNIDTESN
jgi:hypothetical protein